MKVYTKTGDGGTTSLIGGARVPKYDLRVEAYGTVDELAAHLALLADTMREDGRFESEAHRLDEIQKDLFAVEAILATGEGGANPTTSLPESSIRRLEDQIDEMSEGLPAVKGFTIPGGHPVVSLCHVCRTVCRRAERTAVEAGCNFEIPAAPVEYLNRLSDWLYVLGRRASVILSLKERYWMP